jgi:hypothetical protein
MQFPQSQCCNNSYLPPYNGSYSGCGNDYPIVPGTNPALQTWNGQAFVVADGSAQNRISLPFLQVNSGAATYVVGADNNGVWSYYSPNLSPNLSGGSAGQVPWQISTNVTGFTATGVAGELLQSGATNSPTWITPNNLLVTATGSTTARTLANRFATALNVKDFGAIGNGIADDTAAIQLAIDYCISQNGRTLFFPQGTYIISSTINITDACELLGENLSSIIQTSASFSNGDAFYVTGPLSQVGRAITINNIFFNASAIRNSGYYINFYGNSTSRINNCQFWSGYNAVGYTGQASSYHKMYNCIIHDNANIGIDILGYSANQGNVDLVISDVFIAGSTQLVNTDTGIHIAAAGDISLRHVSTVYCNTGLRIDPVFGKRAQAVFVTDSFFDSGNGWGIYCYTQLGRINLLSITQTWVATNQQGGIYLGGTGIVQQVNLNDVYCSNNGGIGLYIASSCQNITVNGGTFASNNSHGIYVAPNTNNFMIRGVISGPTGEFIGNSGYGITIDTGTSNNYIVSNNELAGNTLGAFFDGGSGTNKITYSNLGIGTPITTNAVPSTQWGINYSQQGFYPITASGTYQLAVGSGMVMLHNNNDGSLGLFLAYAGLVTKVSGSASMVSGAAGANQIGLEYNSGAGKYQISNGFATTQNIYIAGLQTRDVS